MHSVKVINNSSTVKVIPAITERCVEFPAEIPKKRVCAYCRVSTDQEDQQSSYELQMEHYTNFIRQNELWVFSGIYADEGISGTSTKNRTKFQQMIEDCKSGKIDLIITKSISRFARNTLDCLNYVRMLKALPSPVGVYFEKENIDTLDAKSELLLTILSSLAQDESRNISENVRWAIQKRFQQGKAHCPTAFFLGYDTDENGNLVINENQAVTVRRIYKEFLDGNGTNKIASGLTKDKIKTGKGNIVWSANSVYRILRNEKYCGDILMQKRVTLDFLTHKRVVNKGHQPQYFIANHHPAIISKEDWNAVQLELDRRYNMNSKNSKGQRHSNRTVFSNVLYCGSCGEPFIRRTFTSTRNNEKYLYGSWKCRVADGRIQGANCRAKSYREKAIEHTFMAMLLDMKHDEEMLIKEANRALSDIDLDDCDKERMRFLELEIVSMEKKLSQVAGSALRNTSVDVYDDISIQIAQEINVLQSEWDKLNEKQHEASMIRRNLNWLIDELHGIENFNLEYQHLEFRDDIFRRIVQRGDVFDDGTIIYTLKVGVTRKAKGNDVAVWKFLKNK